MNLERENALKQVQIDRLTIAAIVNRRLIKDLLEEKAIKSQVNDGCATKQFVSKFARKFEVTDILGKGGFGLVFKAVNLDDRQVYAVKRIAVQPNDAEEKWKEANTFALFDHPSIVRYYRTWSEYPPVGMQPEEDGKLFKNFASRRDFYPEYNTACSFIYIQMQLCDCSLTTWLRNNATAHARQLPKMKQWCKQLLCAVAYLHEKGFIHRDLKPCNILVFEGRRLKICDMGTTVDQRMTNGMETGVEGGIMSRDYMSPEQWDIEENVTTKSDAYSVGLICTEMTLIMTKEWKLEVFDNYRQGIPNEIYGHCCETERFVRRLTQLNPDARPSCQEALCDTFLLGISTDYDL